MPDSAGRPRQVSDDQVFYAVAQVITEHGPAGLTLNRVAAELGVTGPALGYRFKNKRGLLLAFAARQPSATDEHFDQICKRSISPKAAILDALVSIGKAMQTRSEVANNVAMLSLDLADKELGHHAAAQSRIIRRRLCDLLAAAGVAQECLEEATDDLYITWNGAAIAWAIDGNGSLADWVEVRITRVLDRELPTPETQSSHSRMDEEADSLGFEP